MRLNIDWSLLLPVDKGSYTCFVCPNLSYFGFDSGSSGAFLSSIAKSDTCSGAGSGSGRDMGGCGSGSSDTSSSSSNSSVSGGD